MGEGQTWTSPILMADVIRASRIAAAQGVGLGERYPELEPLLATPCDLLVYHKGLHNDR